MIGVLYDSKNLAGHSSKQSWKYIGAWRQRPNVDARKWCHMVQPVNDMRDLLSVENKLWEKEGSVGSRYILDYSKRRRGETVSLKNNEKLPAPSLSHPSNHLNHQDGRKIEGETEKNSFRKEATVPCWCRGERTQKYHNEWCPQNCVCLQAEFGVERASFLAATNYPRSAFATAFIQASSVSVPHQYAVKSPVQGQLC